MKKSFWKRIPPVAAAALLAAACSEGETVYDADTGSVAIIEKIELTEPAGADRISVRITPGGAAARYEFAIGTEADYEAFAEGTLTTQKAEGNQPTEYTFTELEKDAYYTVFARAFAQDGTPGPVSNTVARTFTGDLEVGTQFLGYESLAFTITPSANYRSVEYMLATSADDIKAFESAEGTPAKSTEDDVFRAFTATYFDLEPGTRYYFFVRGTDRYGNHTPTIVTEAETYTPDKTPSIEITSDIADFWITRYTFAPNELTGMYFLMYVEAGALDGFYMSMQAYGGDYMQYLVNQGAAGKNVYTDEQTLPYVHENQDLERGYEIYVLLFDLDGKPASVVRKSWQTPSYDPQAGQAEVGIRVEPSPKGATYYWSPNDATVGFYYETFTADLIDGTDPYNPGAKDEQWVKDWFTANAMSYQMTGKWNYRYLPELGYWEDSWTDDSGDDLEPGTELVIYVMPLNANGLVDGIGKLTSQRYSTPN